LVNEKLKERKLGIAQTIFFLMFLLFQLQLVI
jgi:hypothetical protein